RVLDRPGQLLPAGRLFVWANRFTVADRREYLIPGSPPRPNDLKRSTVTVNEPRPLLILKQLSKTYGDNKVLDTFDLTIFDGEFFTLLGPSGCGKTTVLRMIAGLEEADSGSIHLAGELISNLPAERRPVNTVFKSCSIFQRMTVFDNVSIVLKMSKVPKSEIKPRVMEALYMVRLADFARRKPAQLSGGKQQRVAIARAVVNRPKL